MTTTDTIKTRIKTWVETALDDAGSEDSSITTDWTVKIQDVRKLPFGTIKMEPISWQRLVYGNKIPADGLHVIVDFSINITNKADMDYEDTNPVQYKVMDDVDNIVDYLIGRDQNSTEQGTYNILRVYDIEYGKIRTGLKKMMTMNITGKLLVAWPD